MASKVVAATMNLRMEALSAETVETCRLLVDFLHAAYAARHESDLAGSGEVYVGSPTRETVEAGDRDERARRARRGRRQFGRAEVTTHSQVRTMSSHAVRAAIHVHQHGERTIGELAAGLGISYGWASRVVDELEAANYVIRERDPYDHRIVRIRLDPAAIEAVEHAYRWREHDVREALEPLSDDARDAVRVFLRSVTDRLRSGRDERPGSGGRV
jgi:DNA-binding MarR family transcriptional regulator